MKLAIIGGGGFRVPQIFQAVSGAGTDLELAQIVLHDVSPQRLAVMADVLEQAGREMPRPVPVTTTTDLDDALRGADFVFVAIRVGGTAGRVVDETLALEHGVLGQETVGAGGLAYALRTVPVARALAHRVAAVAPQAWVISFTNPAGIITQAMREVLGARVVGICDTPIGLVRRAARAVGRTPPEVGFDYVGLNHLGWLRTLVVDGHDELPGLLADDERLDIMEEARILGFDWVRALGAIPNEYLFYYYRHRAAMGRIGSGDPTRGQFLDEQQRRFYRAAQATPERAYRLWDEARHDRESSYMGESRPAADRFARRAADVEGGGYQEVALDLMTALATGRATTMILGVGNTDLPGGALVPELGSDAVLEVPCTVDAAGIRPHRIAPVAAEMAGLMLRVKAAEELVLRATAEGSRALAWRALAAHPLVDSVAVAHRLLEAYCAHEPQVAAALR